MTAYVGVMDTKQLKRKMETAKNIEEFDAARSAWIAELKRRLETISPEPEPDYPQIIRTACETISAPVETVADILGASVRTVEGWAQGRRPSEEWRPKLVALERYQSGK